MKNCPKVYDLEDLVKQANDNTIMRQLITGNGNFRWVPARPINYISLRKRFKAAWLVFTGKADVVTWPEDKPVTAQR